MSENDKRGLAGWLGLRAPFDYSKARWLGPVLSGLVLLLFILAIASAGKMLGVAVFGGASLTPGNSLGVGAVTVALIGAPFVIWRSVVAQKSVDVQEQGQITDRINKAVEGLGAEKTKNRMGRTIKYTEIKDQIEREFETFEWQEAPFLTQGKQLTSGPEFGPWTLFTETAPNLEVRIGAIYALERISQDSARDHIQIMEILCAYIRQNAGREDVPLPEGEPTPEEWRMWAQEGRQHPRLDVDVALKVIERRGAARRQLEKDKNPPYQLGFERARLRKIILAQRDLSCADLQNAELQGAELGVAQLKGANLWAANLQGANLWGANLQRVQLRQADLRGAILGVADLRYANLESAHLQDADLSSARMHGAKLSFARLQDSNMHGVELPRADLQFALLQGADLSHALLDGAYFWNTTFDGLTNLRSATFCGAAVRSVDFICVPQIAEHVNSIFGDSSVRLPGGRRPGHEGWPSHWPKFRLDEKRFLEEWRKWQADPDYYTPPKTPEKE